MNELLLHYLHSLIDNVRLSYTSHLAGLYDVFILFYCLGSSQNNLIVITPIDNSEIVDYESIRGEKKTTQKLHKIM